MRISYSYFLGRKCPRLIVKGLHGDRPEVIHDEKETIDGIEVHELLSDFVQADEEARASIREELAGKISELSMIDVISSLERKLRDINLIEAIPEEKIVLPYKGHEIVVIPDLLLIYKDRVEIYDYKTSWGLQVKPEWETQAKLYAYVVKEHLRQETRLDLRPEFYIWLVRNNSIIPVSVPSMESITRWLDREIRKLLKFAELDHAEPRVGRDCWYCPFILSCPAGKNTVILDEKTAKEELKHILRLQTELTLRKKRLRDWIEKHGNLVVDGKEYGYLPRATMKVDIEGLMNYLERERPELIGEVLRADKNKLRAWLKKDPNLEEFIHLETELAYDSRLYGRKVENAF